MLTSHTHACLALVLIAITRISAAADSAETDRPASAKTDLASGDIILAGLKANEAKIENLMVTTTFDKLVTFGLPEGKEARLKFKTEALVTTDGKVAYTTEGDLTFNIGDGRILVGKATGVHDGDVFKEVGFSATGTPRSASIDKYASWYGVNPLEFTIWYFQRPVSQAFADRELIVVEESQWDDRDVLVVETSPFMNMQKWKTRFWIDVDRNYTVVRRAALIQYEPDQPWQEYTRIEGRDHREIEPGIWLPMQVKYESVNTSKDLKPPTVAWRHEGTNENWKVNQVLPADRFKLEFPSGVIVNDHRPKQAEKTEET